MSDPRLETELETTHSQLETLRKQLSVLKTENSDLSGESAKLQSELSSTKAELAQLSVGKQEAELQGASPILVHRFFFFIACKIIITLYNSI